MDAQKSGAFIAECRKEKGLTQANLAVKLHVTDKAVSRWERGAGFPDINTIEPLAQALGISVLELMKSEKIIKDEFTREETAKVITDTLKIAKLQRKQERKTAFKILGITSAAIIFILCLDNMQWQIDTILFTGIGVVLPLFCICGSAVLTGYGIWRKATGRPSGQTFALAIALCLLLIFFFGFFIFAGVMGIGPVPS